MMNHKKARNIKALNLKPNEPTSHQQSNMQTMRDESICMTPLTRKAAPETKKNEDLESLYNRNAISALERTKESIIESEVP